MVYFDNNSTTRVFESTLEAMRPFLTRDFANPASAIAQFGGLARAVGAQKSILAKSLRADEAAQFVITSGATESNNLALLGAARANPARRHVVISSIEPPSVMEVAGSLRADGYRLDILPVSPNGVIQGSELLPVLCRDTLLVSVMLANNETGVIQPLRELADTIKKYDPGILVHTDATQAVGKILVDLSDELADIDLLSLSAHKFHGPKGVGALFIRDADSLSPILYGGGQQNKLRPGTENPASLVGMVAALSTILTSSAQLFEVCQLRDHLESGILALYADAYVLGASAARLPTTLNICLPGIEAEHFVDRLAARGIAISAGSACSYGARRPSYVALAHGVSYEHAKSCVRLSLSIESTQHEVDLCLRAFSEELRCPEMLLNDGRETA
jgi:cysteine desulfurase